MDLHARGVPTQWWMLEMASFSYRNGVLMVESCMGGRSFGVRVLFN